MFSLTDKDKYCYIKRERGYGDGMFKILSRQKDEVTVRSCDAREPMHRDAGTFNIYKAHCYTTRETKLKSTGG